MHGKKTHKKAQTSECEKRCEPRNIKRSLSKCVQSGCSGFRFICYFDQIDFELYGDVNAVLLMNSYEDNTIGLDDRNEYQQILPLVRVESDKSNNLDEIFTLIINKEAKKSDRISADKLTQPNLCKLDAFGTALAG